MSKKKQTKSKPKAKAEKAAKPVTRTPRSVPLPGMEQVTNRTLNRICEAPSATCGRT